jgi:hypothetical protein
MPNLTTRRAALASLGLSGALIASSAVAVLAQDEAEAAGESVVGSFDFETDAQGWEPIVVDLPEGYDPEVGDLVTEWLPLPEGLEGHGLYGQGANQSDDLFIGWKARVDGLAPATEYLVEPILTMASNIPAEVVGQPSSPAEVYVKFGAIDREPAAVVDDEGWLRLNADKGRGAEGGRNAVVLGTIGNPNLELGDDFRTFALHDLSTDDVVRELTGTTDAEGSLWLFMGTDSGYAGFTTQFYDQLDVTLTPQ